MNLQVTVFCIGARPKMQSFLSGKKKEQYYFNKMHTGSHMSAKMKFIGPKFIVIKKAPTVHLETKTQFMIRNDTSHGDSYN